MNKIRFSGYHVVHSADFIFDLPNGHDCWLLLLTHTPANFLVDDNLVEYPAHSAVLFPPNKKIYYSASKSTYENDWLRFDSDEEYVFNFPIQGVPFSPYDPEFCHQLITLMNWEHTEYKKDTSSTMDYLFLILFEKLRNIHHQIALPLTHQLMQLRKEVHNTPQKAWTVIGMAERLHVSAGYFQMLYKKTFGISCMNDVIQKRIQMAQDLLINSNLSANEISQATGYHNSEHFHRQFKKTIGLTPLAYRKKFSYTHVLSTTD